jgi:hypothetical protein
MGGLVIDIFVEFYVRAAILALKRLRSAHWPATAASVTTAVWRAKPGLGCDLAMIQYRYSVGGTLYLGSHNEPFCLSGGGDGFVKGLPPGTAAHIRYNPQDPARSIFVDRWWRKL